MSRASKATRAAVARSVAAVIADGRSLDAALAGQRDRLSDASHSLHAKLSYGVLRHYRALEWLLGRLMRKPLPAREREVHALLLSGLYELWQLRTPAHAAVGETVNATAPLQRPGLRGLCNGVLRAFVRQQDALLAELAAQSTPLAVRVSHPDWLIDAFASDWPEHCASMADANNVQAPMWLRVNAMHGDAAQYAERVRAELGIDAHICEAVAGAVRLQSPVSVHALPGFDEGHVSVQDLSPQFVGHLADVAPSMRVLDACAAPGGKAAHLQELAGNQLQMTALDVDAARLQRVEETFARLRLDADILCADAAQPDAWWDGNAYDRIIIDAPCTATGVIRRHPDIKWLRRESDVAAMASRQQQLLQSLWPLLAPGGCLLFATCSVLRAENHAVIKAFVESTDDTIVSNELRDDNISGLMLNERWGLSVLPGMHLADGFFISRITKKPG
ncbi:MAG: 16S rRNA (cytosine(967)-C(5))-methyltransferase RsmB [Pseudomonadota bacterium]